MATAAATSGAKGVKRDVPFSWSGMDKKGNRVSGKSLAPDETALRADLRRQGIAVSSIKKQSQAFKSGGKVNAADIAVFSRQLATMLAAGIPLVQSFEIVGNGNDKPSMQRLILDIKADVEGGTSLHEALGKHPLYFDDLFVNLVVAVIVTVILLLFVIPQFESLFKGFGADLPAFTQFVINMSRWLQDNWYILFGLIGAAIYAFIYFKKRSKAMREFLDRMLLKFPIIGPIMYKSAVARFARTLSTMFAAGVPLVEALESVA